MKELDLRTHPLQSPAWGAFRKAMGVDVAWVNNWLLTFHKVPFTPWTIGYFPKGPKPTRAMIETLETLGRKKNAIFIQLEPNVLQPTTHNLQPLIPSHHPLFTKYTFILDLTKSEEELLREMHSKTRYNIKVAQKHGVVVNEDSNAFEQYLRLTKETTNRQGFYAHNETYHRTMWNVMHKADIAHLFTASYKGEIVSTWIVFIYGNTIYYPYGASSREHRNVMAPTLLLWEIARWAKKKGLRYFDLWGALGPPPTGGHDENDPWYGFHRFKQGFGPDLIEFVGSYDLIIIPILYRLYSIVDTLRWFVLKVLAR